MSLADSPSSIPGSSSASTFNAKVNNLSLCQWFPELRDSLLRHLPAYLKPLVFLIFFSHITEAKLHLKNKELTPGDPCFRSMQFSTFSTYSTFSTFALQVSQIVRRPRPRNTYGISLPVNLTPGLLLAQLINTLLAIHFVPSRVMGLPAAEIGNLLRDNTWLFSHLKYSSISECLTREFALRYLQDRRPYDVKLFQLALKNNWHDVIAIYLSLYGDRIALTQKRMEGIAAGRARFALKSIPNVHVGPNAEGTQLTVLPRRRELFTWKN
jgi:hypothetical protein